METNNNTSFSSLVLHNELNNSHYEVTKQAQIENMKRKAYCDISRTQHWKNKKNLATYLEKSSTFLNSIGLEFDQIILTNKNHETNHFLCITCTSLQNSMVMLTYSINKVWRNE
jgi:hypothetical protein